MIADKTVRAVLYPAALFLCLAALALLSLAQDSADTFDFDIAEMPLEEALAEFSRLTRRQVSADSSAIRGLKSTAVQGRLAAQSALVQMLRGTGVELVSVNGRSFALRPGETSPAVTSRPDGGPVLDTITVTGQLLERTLQDTHASLTVLSGEELEREINRDLYDVIERVAGVNMEPGGFGFVIRGIKTQGQNASVGTNAISYQIDGVVVNDFQAIRQGPASVWDLEQVEILRGPQSTQQGQNALAGAIIMRSKDPIQAFEAKARVDLGSFDERRFAAALNVPLSDAWAFRVSAEDYSNEGDVQHWITGEELGDGGLETYRAKLRYNNQNNFDAILSFSRSNNELASQSIRPELWPEERRDTIRQARSAETDATSLLLSYELDERWSFRSETGHISTDWFVLQVPEPFNPDPFAQFAADSVRESQGLTQELKATFDGERLRWVAGLYYADNEAEGIDRPTGASQGGQDSQNVALFSELEYDFSYRWMGVLGLRFDDETRDFFSPSLDDEQNTTELLPKIGLIYNISDQQSLGFTAQRAYRAGGVFQDYFDPTNISEFDPEFTTNYELSFRSLTLDDRLKFNANAFYTDYEDMQLVSLEVDFATFTGTSSISNVGQARLYGGEIETSYKASEQLNVFLNIGYVKSEIEEDVAGNRGNEFPLAPALTGSVGGQYAFNAQWDLGLVASFTDSFFFSENNLPGEVNPSYALLDGQLSYRKDNWGLTMYGRNLLDREYTTRRRVGGGGWTVGDPRFVGVSFRIDFL